MSVNVRKPGFYRRIKRVSDKLFKLYGWFCVGINGFDFEILSGGLILIESFEKKYSSGESYGTQYGSQIPTDDEMRANTLLLFNQLKDRALPKIVKKVEKDARHNQEVIEAVRKALEPFMPQIVADELAK